MQMCHCSIALALLPFPVCWQGGGGVVVTLKKENLMYGSTHVEARQMSKGNFRRRAPNFSSQEDPLLSVSAFFPLYASSTRMYRWDSL